MKIILQLFFMIFLFDNVFAKKIEETKLGKDAALIAADWRNEISRLSGFSEADRGKVVEILRGVESREITSIGNISPSNIGARSALIAIDDEPTIDRLVQIYRRYDSRAAWVDIPQTFQKVANPYVISYLAPDFYLEDDLEASYGYRNEWESIGAPPRSIWSSIVSVRIIEKSPEFNQAMKAWAREVYELSSRDEALCRRVMRAWWTKNKVLFEQGKYMEVQPVNLQDFETEVISKGEQSVTKPLPTEMPSAKPEPWPVATAHQMPEKSGSNWLVILAVTVVVGGSVAMLLWLIKGK